MTEPCDGDDGGVTGQTWCFIEDYHTGRQDWNADAIGTNEDIGLNTDHHWSGFCKDGSTIELNFTRINTEECCDFVAVRKLFISAA